MHRHSHDNDRGMHERMHTGTSILYSDTFDANLAQGNIDCDR